MIGAHFDSFSDGAFDSAGGTASLLAITRGLHGLYQTSGIIFGNVLVYTENFWWCTSYTYEYCSITLNSYTCVFYQSSSSNIDYREVSILSRLNTWVIQKICNEAC